MTNKIRFNRWGLAENPIGLIVSMSWKGRTILGKVGHTYRREVPSAIMLEVYHFNGEPWPIDPVASAVSVV